MKFSRIERRQRAQRRGANRRARIGEHVEQRVARSPGAWSAADRADTLRAARADRLVRVADDLRRAAAPPTDRRCGRARERFRSARCARRSTAAAAAPAAAARSFSAPSPLTANARVYGLRILGERQQRRQRALVLEPLQRERDRPPAHARLAAARRAPRPPAAGTPSAARARRRRAGTPPSACRGAHRRLRPRRLRERARLRRSARRSAPIGVGGGGIADQAERFGGAALHERRRIGERGDQRIARARRRRAGRARTRPSAALPDRHRRAAASSGVTPSASPTWPMASAARRRMRASSSDSSRRRSGGGGGGGATAAAFWPRPARRRRRRDERRRIAQHALILEPQDRTPSSVRRSDRRRLRAARRRRRARARRTRPMRASARAAETDSSLQRLGASDCSELRLRARRAAPERGARRPVRHESMTPRPGAVGTAMVPSAATSIGGSIRSGSK